MLVRRPIFLVQMQLHITRHLRFGSKTNSRAQKIRTAQLVPTPGMEDFNPLALRGQRPTPIKITPEPNFLQQVFGERITAI